MAITKAPIQRIDVDLRALLARTNRTMRVHQSIDLRGGGAPLRNRFPSGFRMGARLKLWTLCKAAHSFCACFTTAPVPFTRIRCRR
jgi:hypothetical protein